MRRVRSEVLEGCLHLDLYRLGGCSRAYEFEVQQRLIEGACSRQARTSGFIKEPVGVVTQGPVLSSYGSRSLGTRTSTKTTPAYGNSHMRPHTVCMRMT